MFAFGWISLSLCSSLVFSFRSLFVVGRLELKSVGLLLEVGNLYMEMFRFVEYWCFGGEVSYIWCLMFTLCMSVAIYFLFFLHPFGLVA